MQDVVSERYLLKYLFALDLRPTIPTSSDTPQREAKEEQYS